MNFHDFQIEKRGPNNHFVRVDNRTAEELTDDQAALVAMAALFGRPIPFVQSPEEREKVILISPAGAA